MRALVPPILLALVATACSGPDPVYEARPARASRARQLALPAPTPAVPVFAARARAAVDEKALEKVESLAGVAVAAPIVRFAASTTSPRARRRLRVAAVDLTSFRSVAPPATKAAEFVWASLLAGDAILTHKAAKQLRLRLRRAVKIRVRGLGSMHVGGVASNGTPNLADVLIDAEAHRIPTDEATLIVIGARSGATLESIEGAVKSHLKGARLTELLPRTDQIPDSSRGTVVAAASTPVAPPAPPPVAAGLHPVLGSAVAQLISASSERIWVVSGYRSFAHQAYLWRRALARYGDPEIADNWVAYPGNSMHERGLAVDLGGDLELAAELIARLRLPLWRPMSWEPWHFELTGSRG